jgi:hypothetical protein
MRTSGLEGIILVLVLPLNLVAADVRRLKLCALVDVCARC